MKAVFLLLALAAPSFAQDAGPSDAEIGAVASNAYAMRMFHLYRQSTEGNFSFSPYSSHQVASMLADGAGGETLDELAALTHLPKDEAMRMKWVRALQVTLAGATAGGGVQLGVANSLWSPPGLSFAPAFVAAAQTSYVALAQELPPGDAVQSAALINNWVRQKTRGKFSNVVGPDNFSREAPNVVLVNAAYLKSSWANMFDPKQTKPRDFYLPDGTSTQLDLMMKTEQCRYAEAEGWQCLSMPFKSSQVSFYILLPRDTAARKQVETRLSLDSWTATCEGMTSTEAVIFLPRFSYTTETALLPMWQALGLSKAITTQADFRKMIPSAPCLISKAIHSATIEVDEIGAEAAAVTAVTADPFGPSDVPEKPKRIIFRADRPFLWFIVHEPTGLMLFCGRFAGK